MTQYPKDIIDYIQDGAKTGRTIQRVTGKGALPISSVSLAVSNLTLTPRLERQPVTGEDIGIVEIDFTEPATDLVNPIREYVITWSTPGNNVVETRIANPPPPIAYYGLPVGVLITIQVTPRTSVGTLGTPVQDTVTITADTVAPDQPSTPAVSGGFASGIVTWDGLDVQSDPMPSDFRRLDIYTGPSDGFNPETQGVRQGYIVSPSGGTITFFSDSYDTPVWVRTVAVDHAGNESVPSTAQSFTPSRATDVDFEIGAIGYGAIAFKQAGNLIPDGSYETASYRAALEGVGAHVTFDNTEGNNSTWSLTLTPDGTTQIVPLLEGSGIGPGNRCMQVNALDKFMFRTAFRHTAGTNGVATLQLIPYDSAGTPLTEPVPVDLDVDDVVSWKENSGFLLMPNEAVFVEPRIVLEMSSTTGQWWFDLTELRTVIQTKIIDDAAIGNAQIADLAVNDAKIGDLKVGKITGGTIQADLLIGSRLTTAANGSRAEISPEGLNVFGDDEEILVRLSTDTEQEPYFRGEVEAGGLVVTGRTSFRGMQNDLARGSQLSLNQKVIAPSNKPTVIMDWPEAFEFEIGVEDTRTLDPEEVRYWTQNPNGTWIGTLRDPINSQFYLCRIWDTDGSFLGSPFGGTTGSHISSGFKSSVQLQANQEFFAVNEQGGEFVLAKMEFGLQVQTASVGFLSNGSPPVLGYYDNAGTLEIISAQMDDANTRIIFKRINPDTMTVIATTNSTSNARHTGPLGTVRRGAFDIGSERWITSRKGYILIPPGYVHNYWAYFTAGGLDTNNDFAVPPGGTDGLGWNGTHFLTVIQGKAKTHSSITWTTESSKWWSSFTYGDTDATGGTHETDQSPKASWTMKKRAQLHIGIGDIPVGAGGPDDPNVAGLYLGRGATEPVATSMWWQTNLSPGILSVFRTTADFSGASAPTSNNFPDATPAKIVSSDGVTLELTADGTIKGAEAIFTATSDANTNAGNEPPVRVGDITGNHLRMDGNEIISMANDSTKGVLGLQGRFFSGFDYGANAVSLNGSGVGTISHSIGKTPTAVVCTSQDSQIIFRVQNKNSSTFQVQCFAIGGGTINSTTREVLWIAIAS